MTQKSDKEVISRIIETVQFVTHFINFAALKYNQIKYM